jgi:hypothetical protein
MRFPLAVLTALVFATGIVTVASAQSEDTRLPQGSSVGDGDGPAPAIATAVKSAARSGGCSVRSFASAGFQHGIGSFSYPQTPATSGTHAGRWADWGFYEEVVPAQYQVHNLEHGGVIFHFGRRTPDSAGERLGTFFASEPGYLVITARASKKLVPAAPGLKAFPESGFVVTSWQRRLVCKRANAKSLKAAFAFIRRYRGTGREQIPAVNSTTERPADLPAPAVASEQPSA